MKKLLFLFCFIVAITNLKAQVAYVDPAVAGAISISSQTLRSEQNKTNNLLTQIKTAQMAVNAQLAAAQRLQDKIYKGLSEVSGALNDAFVVKQIYENTTKIVEKSAEITAFAARNPQYAYFARKEATNFRNRLVSLTAEVTQALTGGEFNLMSAGQRRELLRNIQTQTSLLAGHAWYMLYTMERAKTIGFWKAINPFATWVNTDQRMASDIIRRSKFL